jgi:hypothetical protein
LGLKHLPDEAIERFADTLDLLNMGDNNLSSLPPSFASFRSLRVLFFANNQFEVVPSVLGVLPSLYMLSFKGNRVAEVPENCLSSSVGWLILSDNCISELPPSIGKLTGLRKCMLAGNCIKSLPPEMAQCRELELLRLAANELDELPEWLLQLPKLSWLALAGNPCLLSPPTPYVDKVLWEQVVTTSVLGEGASGIVYRATVENESSEMRTVAVKTFKGEATSDGLPVDEMRAAMYLGSSSGDGGRGHPCITPVLGHILKLKKNDEELPEGLIFELIPPEFSNLGDPPSFQTVTRDTFPAGLSFHPSRIFTIARAVASACVYMHSKHSSHAISHGDLYAHNLLVTAPATWDDIGAVDVRLCDMGAATFYDPETPAGSLLERIEVRAFGCLLEDMLLRLPDGLDRDSLALSRRLTVVSSMCMSPTVGKRPSFQHVLEELDHYVLRGSVYDTLTNNVGIMSASVVVMGCIAGFLMRRHK